MAELETTDTARQDLERVLARFPAEHAGHESIAVAIARFLLAHSHNRPAEARLRVELVGGLALLDRTVDLNLNTTFALNLERLGLPRHEVRVSLFPIQEA